MSQDLSPRSRARALPTVSYGPYGLIEAVPWLMLAAAFRFAGYAAPALGVPAFVLASLALFLAFLLAARRMIEFADGTTQLGKLSFSEQMQLARRILRDVLLLLVAAMIIVAFAGYPKAAIHVLG